MRSGSLITARLANEMGRDIFALPGSIHAPLSRGCHRIIKQGAKLVETPDEVLEELGRAAAVAKPGGSASAMRPVPLAANTVRAAGQSRRRGPTSAALTPKRSSTHSATPPPRLKFLPPAPRWGTRHYKTRCCSSNSPAR